MTWILKQVARLLWSASSCSRKQHILDAWGCKMWENNEQESIYLPPKIVCFFLSYSCTASLWYLGQMSLEQPVVVQLSSASSSHFCQMAERNESTPAEYFRRPRSCWMNFLWLAICQISQWHLKLICGNRSTERELNVGRVIITHLPVSHALIWDNNLSYYQLTKHFSSVVGLK